MVTFNGTELYIVGTCSLKGLSLAKYPSKSDIGCIFFFFAGGYNFFTVKTP